LTGSKKGGTTVYVCGLHERQRYSQPKLIARLRRVGEGHGVAHLRMHDIEDETHRTPGLNTPRMKYSLREGLKIMFNEPVGGWQPRIDPAGGSASQPVAISFDGAALPRHRVLDELDEVVSFTVNLKPTALENNRART